MDAGLLIREAREGARLSQHELARRAGTSQPAVSRYESGRASPSVATLERLLAASGSRVEASLLPAERTFDASTDRMRLLRENRAAVLGCARRHGAGRVRVFGSVVRGEDGPSSDIDLLVDLDVERVGLFPLDDLRIDLEAILGERVDVVADSLLAPHVAVRAHAEAVAL